MIPSAATTALRVLRPSVGGALDRFPVPGRSCRACPPLVFGPAAGLFGVGSGGGQHVGQRKMRYQRLGMVSVVKTLFNIFNDTLRNLFYRPQWKGFGNSKDAYKAGNEIGKRFDFISKFSNFLFVNIKGNVCVSDASCHAVWGLFIIISFINHIKIWISWVSISFDALYIIRVSSQSVQLIDVFLHRTNLRNQVVDPSLNGVFRHQSCFHGVSGVCHGKRWASGSPFRSPASCILRCVVGSDSVWKRLFSRRGRRLFGGFVRSHDGDEALIHAGQPGRQTAHLAAQFGDGLRMAALLRLDVAHHVDQGVQPLKHIVVFGHCVVPRSGAAWNTAFRLHYSVVGRQRLDRTVAFRHSPPWSLETSSKRHAAFATRVAAIFMPGLRPAHPHRRGSDNKTPARGIFRPALLRFLAPGARAAIESSSASATPSKGAAS